MAMRRLFRSPIRLQRADKQKAAEMKSLVRLLLLLSGAFAVIPAKL
jgi:hypothetical protein